MSEKEPFVAVIIPCHNHSDYVLNAIESVATQDYSRVMMSIVDDGSTDNSYDKIKSILNLTSEGLDEGTQDIVCTGSYKDRPVILHKNSEAKKQASARNTAIKRAWQMADLFMQLDADDLLLQYKVSLSVAAWLNNPKHIGLVYSDVLIHNTDNDTYVREFRPSYDRQLLERENIISNAPLISKYALGQCGLYDEELPPCEDWDLWLRITEHFFAIHIPLPLQQYTVTGLNCTFTVDSKVWAKQWQRVQQKLRERKHHSGNG